MREETREKMKKRLQELKIIARRTSSPNDVVLEEIIDMLSEILGEEIEYNPSRR